MMRINVVGTSGAGKSTFAKQLADKLNYPYVSLDVLYWRPNWTEPTDAEFFPKVTAALNSTAWVLDGNYSRTRPIKWKDVTTVIWLDYPFSVVLFRVIKRALIRAITQEELWPGTGNRESFQRSFFSKQSIILWTLKTFHKSRVQYESDRENKAFEHIQFVRLSSPREARRFLNQMGQ